MKLERRVIFKSDNLIAPICLPASENENFAGEQAIVNGWGSFRQIRGNLNAWILKKYIYLYIKNVQKYN